MARQPPTNNYVTQTTLIKIEDLMFDTATFLYYFLQQLWEFIGSLFISTARSQGNLTFSSIYIPGLYIFNGVAKVSHFSVRGDIILSSPSAPCLSIGGNTQEFPKPYTPSLLVKKGPVENIVAVFLQTHHRTELLI